MTERFSTMQTLFAGTQVTLLGIFALMLGVVLPEASVDAFAGAGILAAIAGTAVVGYGVAD